MTLAKRWRSASSRACNSGSSAGGPSTRVTESTTVRLVTRVTLARRDLPALHRWGTAAAMAKTRASAKKPAAKKPAAAKKKPAATKKPAQTPVPRAKKSVGKRKGPPPIDELDASDVLARITVFSRAEEDADGDLEPLLVR